MLMTKTEEESAPRLGLLKDTRAFACWGVWGAKAKRERLQLMTETEFPGNSSTFLGKRSQSKLNLF